MTISAQGTTVGVEDDNGDYINLDCVRTFSGFDGESTEIDTTCLTSSEKEYRLGLRDNGSISLSVFRDDSDPGQARINALLSTGLPNRFRITLNVPETGGDIYEFLGLVKSFNIDASVDNVLEGEIGIRISGPVLYVNN